MLIKYFAFHSDEDHVPSSEMPTTQQQGEAGSSTEPEVEAVEDEDALKMDLNESVQRLEQKCAGVREELGRMALSEQYMRTKQAQLRAKRNEVKAEQAIKLAEEKEREAEVLSRFFTKIKYILIKI